MITANYLQMLQKTQGESDSNVNFEFLGLVGQIIIGSAAHITKELVAFIKHSFGIIIDLNIRALKYTTSSLEQGTNR